MRRQRIHTGHRRRQAARQGGAAAILSMMFLVIFSSLAAAMAIISQGNLATADAHLKVNRCLAAAESGMRYVQYRLDLAAATVQTRDGIIDNSNAPALWLQTRDALYASFLGEPHNLQPPYINGDKLHVGPIATGPGSPAFTAEFIPHPIAGENYNSSYYQRPPYSQMSPAVSNQNPLDATWVRVRVVASDGQGDNRLSRGIQMDFQIEKKIRFAILSKNRVMIGRNVMIEGPVGSTFLETDLEHGHPVHMESDFRGLHPDLDDQLDNLKAWLKVNDVDGDNRLNIHNAAEVQGIDDPASLDVNNDGYIDEFDLFIGHFDTNGDGRVSLTELLSGSTNSIAAEQLMELIDTFGSSGRAGYNDGFIDADDRYAKIRGEVYIKAGLQGWLDGAAHGAYQDYFQGPIHPGHNRAPLTFDSNQADQYDYGPQDFDVSTLRTKANGDLMQQLAEQVNQADPTDPNRPRFDSVGVREEVPYGAAFPYDYYQRPVIENMVFENVRIPKGTNALFRNCVFRGVTFVETETNNLDPNWNYSGMEEADGTAKHPDRTVMVDGVEHASSKPLGNNLRFDNCTFEGSVASDAPQEYTHVRNKIAFTGRTRFDLSNLPAQDKTLHQRSTLMVPHYSVEMGTFVAPSDSNETVHLSGTIVAGLIDMRGQVKVNGTILTTFEPASDEGPVLGQTSPNFNTTLGYFSADAGDLESEIPPNGVGVIQIRYDPTLPLPDGILSSISVRPVVSTYFEVAGN